MNKEGDIFKGEKYKINFSLLGYSYNEMKFLYLLYNTLIKFLIQFKMV